MYNAVKHFIAREFYKTAEEAQNKLDVFYSVNRLSDEQYTELAFLVTETYSA